MKPKILAAFLSDHAFRLTALAAVGKGQGQGGNAHVLFAPSSVGNLGDEAMMTSTLRQLRMRLGDAARIIVMTHNNDDDWSQIDGEIEQRSLAGWFSALGWMKALPVVLSIFREAASFSLLGADMLDGAYSRTRSFRRLLLAEVAVRMGVPARVLGFSYSDQAQLSISTYIANIPRGLELFARDPRSYSRVKKLRDREVAQVADTAFLLEPAADCSAAASSALAFVIEERNRGNVIVAFNANPLGSAMSAGARRGDETLPDLVAIVRRVVLETLTEVPNASLVMISHDPRPPHSDAVLLKAVLAGLPEQMRRRCHDATAGISAREVKRLCAEADVAFTGRMHMGIASLGSGTPCLLLDFQGKVAGLLDLLDVPHYRLEWRQYLEPGACAAAIGRLLQDRESERARLASALPRIRALAHQNFDWIAELEA